MANSDVDVTEGAGKSIATYVISEDAVNREIQRITVNDSAGAEVLGSKADAKNSATDTTAVSAISLLKQVSYQLQQEQPQIINKFASVEGTLVSSTVATIDIDTSAWTAVYEIEIVNKNGADTLNFTIGTSGAAPSNPTVGTFTSPSTVSAGNSGFLPGAGVPASVTLPNNTVAASIRVKLLSGSALPFAIVVRGT
jgi:hypothetical protein